MTETWTPERVAALQAGLDEGLSFAQIGARLGLTKNQCLCKASRLGIGPSDNAPLSRRQRGSRARIDDGFRTTAQRLDGLHAALDRVLRETGRMRSVRAHRAGQA